MDFGGEEKGETHVFIGDLNNPQEPQEEYLWDIQVGYEGAVIKTKLKYQEKDHYYLTYYQAEKDFFRCHFGIKNTIYINKPYVFLFD